MQRPDFDKLTEKEKRQLGAWVNWSNGVEYEAQQRRKRVAEAKNKIEAGIREQDIEGEPKWDLM